MSKARNYFAWQARLVTPALGQRVVEVGCGIGNFTRLLLDREAVIASDVDPDCVAKLKERFPDRKNLQALVCDPCTPEFTDLARFRPDSCVCLNVLEHIGDERKAIEGMASILPPGGRIVLLVPAFQALFGPIDRNLEHWRRYSRKSITALAHEAGLRINVLHYVNLVGFFGWWVNAHVFRLEVQSELQIRIFDRFLVPLMSRVEKLVRPPFGQSLLVVLEKR